MVWRGAARSTDLWQLATVGATPGTAAEVETPKNVDLASRRGERGDRSPLLGDAGGRRSGAEAMAQVPDAVVDGPLA